MKKTFIRNFFFTWITALVTLTLVHAQTITAPTIASAAVCQGGSVSVSFTASAFTGTPTFKVEISDAAGAFTSPVATATGTASPISVVIPAATPAGAGYKARVVTTTPAVTSAASTAFAVNEIPAAPTTQKDVYRCEGDSPIILTAVGTDLKWYSFVGGNPSTTTLLSGAPTVTANTGGMGFPTYPTFLVSQTVGGCESPKSQIYIIPRYKSKTPIIIAPAELCQNAAVPVGYVENSIQGYDYYAYLYNWRDDNGPISDPQLINSKISTATAGTKDYYVKATEAMKCPSAEAKLSIKVNPAPTAPTVANATLNYTVGQGSIPALSATGTSLKWYTVETGGTGTGTAPTPSTTAIGTTKYYVSQTLNTCEGPRTEIVVNVTCGTAAPTVANATLNYTVGQTGIQALTATGTLLKWYTVETGGTGSSTAPIPSTAAIGTTKYYVSQTLNTCEGPRTEIVVNVTCGTAAPTVTNATFNYTVGQTGISALSATGTALKWYTEATGGTGSGTAPVPSTAAIGTTKYYVSQTLNTCEGPRTEIVVNVTCGTAAPTVTNATFNYTVGQTGISALSATGTALKWYTAETGGAGSSTAPTPSTAAAGTTSYYVSQTLNGCEGPRTEIKVIVSACVVSAEPTVTSPLSYCASTDTQAALVATGSTGAVIKWYNASNVLLTSAPVPLTNVATTTTTTYYVTQTETGKCESAKKTVTITVNKTAPPVVSSVPVEFCVGQTATALTATGTALKWYNSTTGTTTVSSTPSAATAGAQIFYVSQTLNGCESERSRIDVKVKASPVAPTAVALAPVCMNTAVASTVLTGAVTPKTNLLWYSASTGGTGSAAAPAVVTSTAGVKNFYVTQTVDGCESAARTVVALEVKETPASPTVSPVDYCKDQIVSSALTASGTALKWYDSATAASPLAAAPKPSSATVGVTSYYVSQTASFTGTTLTCESPRAKLEVEVHGLPANLSNFSDAVCQERQDKTYTFNATPLVGNTVVWYSAATGSDAGSTAVNLKNAGEYTAYAVNKTTSTGCESATRAAFKVRVKALPGLPTIEKPLIEYCQFVGAAPLSAGVQSGAALNWFGTDATGGTSSDVAPVPSTADGGTKSYYVAQTLEGCMGDRAKIDIKINTTPKPSTTTYLAYCQGVVAPRLDAVGSVLKWYRNSTDTEWQGYPYTPFTEKVQDYSFWVTQTGTNGCESPKEEIKIHIKAKPSATISGNSTIDLGQDAFININFTAEGPWEYVLSDGAKGTSTDASTRVRVAPSTTTTYMVTKVKNECGEGSPQGTAVVTVKVPTITTGTPSVAEACAGKSFNVPFQQSGDYPAGNTFKVQIALGTADSLFYSIPSVATTNNITATFPDTTKDGYYYVRVVSSGASSQFLVRGSTSAYGIQANSLPVGTITGTQTVFKGDPATVKVDFTGKGPWQFLLAGGTKDTLITASATPYSFALKPSATTTYTIKEVTNGCGLGKGAGTARVQVDPVLGVEPPVTNWLKVYPTITEGPITVEITGPISPKGSTVQVVDLNGRSLLEQKIQMKTTVMDLSSYGAGLYLIRTQNGNLQTVNKVLKR